MAGHGIGITIQHSLNLRTVLSLVETCIHYLTLHSLQDSELFKLAAKQNRAFYIESTQLGEQTVTVHSIILNGYLVKEQISAFVWGSMKTLTNLKLMSENYYSFRRFSFLVPLKRFCSVVRMCLTKHVYKPFFIVKETCFWKARAPKLS